MIHTHTQTYLPTYLSIYPPTVTDEALDRLEDVLIEDVARIIAKEECRKAAAIEKAKALAKAKAAAKVCVCVRVCACVFVSVGEL